MKISGVIFDKDGTLFDFNATWGAWAETMIAAETAGDHVLYMRFCLSSADDRPVMLLSMVL